jgi:hypothetical protein
MKTVIANLHESVFCVFGRTSAAMIDILHLSFILELVHGKKNNPLGRCEKQRGVTVRY